jgi:hypothetical protein
MSIIKYFIKIKKWVFVLIALFPWALSMAHGSSQSNFHNVENNSSDFQNIGFIDSVEIDGRNLLAFGWADSGDAANPVTGIRILVDSVEVYNGGFEKQSRPDVAENHGRSDLSHSGWLVRSNLSKPINEGLRKISGSAIQKNGKSFDLNVLENSSEVLIKSPANKEALSGQLDHIVLEGDQLNVRGWAASTDPARKIKKILLKSGEEILYHGEFQIQERPDVAAALGKPDWVNSGWIVCMDWSGKPAPSSITPQFEMETGEILSLPPLPIAAQTPAGQPAPSDKLMGTRLPWLAVFLLAGGVAVLVYRAYKRRRNSAHSRDLTSPQLRISDTPSLFILAGVFFSILASKLFLICHFGPEVPFWDQWGSEAMCLLLPYMDGTFSLLDLVAPHNEHRIAVTRLLVLGLFLFNGQWDPMLSMVVQAALHAGILCLLVAIMKSILDSISWRLFAGLTTLFYIVPFSWENTLWGFQSQFYFVLLFGLVGVYFTWKCTDFLIGWCLGWSALTVGLFSMGSGLLAPLAVFCMGLLRMFVAPAPLPRQFAALSTTLLVVFLGMQLIVSFPAHEPLKAQNLGEFFLYFCKLAAWPCENQWCGILLYLPVLVLGVSTIIRRVPFNDPAWLLLTLGAWSAFTIAALAYGRANSPLTSRYTDSLFFALLTSFASGLYIIPLFSKKIRAIAYAILVIGVSVVAGGLLHNFTDHLISDIQLRKSLDIIQKKYVIEFLKTNDKSALKDKPTFHVPFPDADLLAKILSRKPLQEVLPSAIHLGVPPVRAMFSENAFVENAGVYPQTMPVNVKTYFGSYTKTGDASTGKLRLEYPAPPEEPRLSLAVSGYPIKDGMELFIETEKGDKIPIPVCINPRETWHEVVFKNPGVPFSIVAVDGSPSTWVAIGLPTPIGRLSLWSKWLLAHWWIFGAAGVGCFAAGFLFSSPENRKFT